MHPSNDCASEDSQLGSRSSTQACVGQTFPGLKASQRVSSTLNGGQSCIHPITVAVPIILKGVQCWEDALEAYDQGVAGVVLSNHGGRQMDFSRSGIEVLVEVVQKLGEKRGLAFPNEKFQLFVDGGVRRATDVLKAVALGATAGTRVNKP